MVSHTVSKEELVIDNNDFIYKSGSNRKNVIIFAVILLVIFAIVFVALFAVEKNKVAKLTEDAEISKQKDDASKKPMHSTKKPMHSTKKPPSFSSDSVLAAAGESHFYCSGVEKGALTFLHMCFILAQMFEV